MQLGLYNERPVMTIQ